MRYDPDRLRHLHEIVDAREAAVDGLGEKLDDLREQIVNADRDLGRLRSAARPTTLEAQKHLEGQIARAEEKRAQLNDRRTDLSERQATASEELATARSTFNGALAFALDQGLDVPPEFAPQASAPGLPQIVSAGGDRV
jgi:chromosome segregation ATPase